MHEVGSMYHVQRVGKEGGSRGRALARRGVPDLQHIVGEQVLHYEWKKHRAQKDDGEAGGGDHQEGRWNRSKNLCGGQERTLKRRLGHRWSKWKF